MTDIRKILFLTGTRADFGKIKSLIEIIEITDGFEAHIVVTGMHLQKMYGYTLNEILRCNYKNVTKFNNETSEYTMDLSLAKTVIGLSTQIKKINPDLIVVHGDRIEALAGAIVGALNNILVAHIEGGELSGTIDEIIRHSTSKMSHIHFVSNNEARQRLIQMGELDDSIHIIGSPDLDVMFSKKLPNIFEVKKYYEIVFSDYAVVMFHPVTTEFEKMKYYVSQFVDSLLEDNNNYVIIFPNNDLGSKIILDEYKRLENNKRFLIYPSIRFEYFLTLLKKSNFIIGNSSAGIREAPYYNVPTINIGSRQSNRSFNKSIINTDYNKKNILKGIKEVVKIKTEKTYNDFGSGNSSKKFVEILKLKNFWNTNNQKQFKDLNF